jgi:hypothetical protein
MNMNSYSTVSEAVNDLVQQGYTDQLELRRDCLYCSDKQIQLNPEEFAIDGFHRFEGETDPGDEAIVYAVSSKVKNIKGVLVNAYGVYADGATDELIRKLDVR